MRKSLAVCLLFGCLFAASAAAQVSYTAFLTGANEPPNGADPDGVGFVVVTLDPTAGTIAFTAFASNIVFPTTGSHIHRGPAGLNGPIIIPFNLPFADGISAGTLTGISASFIAEIIANPAGYYFNIHNAVHPGGAIRGQLRAAPGTPAPNVQYVPVTVKASGAKGENFVQDVRIVSRAAAPALVTIDFFSTSSTGLLGPTATATVTVGVNQQLVLNDILGATFATSGIGALRFTTLSDVATEARVMNDKRSVGQGQLGFFIHGLPVEAACRFGTLPVLSQASAAEIASGVGLRTNIGYFNPNAAAVGATFTARKTSDGSSLGAVTVTIPGFSHAQSPVFSLINTVALADQKQDDFYVTYSVTNGPLFVYLAVADNFTGDSYYSAGVCGL